MAFIDIQMPTDAGAVPAAMAQTFGLNRAVGGY